MTNEEIIQSYNSLLQERIVQIFDIEEDSLGTWCTIKFSNEEVHCAIIPYVFGWGIDIERKLVREHVTLVSNTLITNKGCRYVCLNTRPCIIWIPVQQKNPEGWKTFIKENENVKTL